MITVYSKKYFLLLFYAFPCKRNRDQKLSRNILVASLVSYALVKYINFVNYSKNLVEKFVFDAIKKTKGQSITKTLDKAEHTLKNCPLLKIENNSS